MWRVWGVSPFLLPFGDCIQLSILPVPVRTTLTELFGLAPMGLLVSSTTRKLPSFDIIIKPCIVRFFSNTRQSPVYHFCDPFVLWRGLSSESNSVSSPPTPSSCLLYISVKNIGIKINLHLMCEFYP